MNQAQSQDEPRSYSVRLRLLGGLIAFLAGGTALIVAIVLVRAVL